MATINISELAPVPRAAWMSAEGANEQPAAEMVMISVEDLNKAKGELTGYATMGLAFGVIIVLIGALLIGVGVVGSTSVVDVAVGENTLKLDTVWPGLLIAVIGAVIVYITRKSGDVIVARSS